MVYEYSEVESWLAFSFTKDGGENGQTNSRSVTWVFDQGAKRKEDSWTGMLI